MKKFLFGIFLFSIPLITIVIGCEMYLRNIPSEYKQKRDQLIENADSIEILILGSSHAMDGADPKHFSLNAHNMAFGAQSIYFDRKLAEKYLPILPRLKYVILNLEFNSLYFENDEYRDFFYKYYYDISYKDKKFIKESISQTIFVYTPEIAFSTIITSLKNGGGNKLVKGWYNPSGRNDEKVMSVEGNKLRAKGFNSVAESWKGGDSVKNDLEALIKLLQSKDIMPVLVTYPNYSLLRSFLDASIIEQNRSTGIELSQKYQIPYLDYFDDDSFILADFFNCDHLNEEGAAKISGKINEVIMNLEEKGIENEKKFIPLLLDNK